MPKCIFCDKDVPHKICQEHPERSLCLDCLVEIRRFEVQNGREIVRRIFPDRVIEAMKRIKTIDPSQATDPQRQAQLMQDIYIVQEILPL